MTSSPDAFDNPGQLVAQVQQQYQGWSPGGQRPYARGLMGIGMIKSRSLYDMSLNRINDIVARFNKHQYVEPDAIVADDAII
jgi:hypothetical protein